MKVLIDINEIAYKNATRIPSIDWNGNLLRIVNDALQDGTPIPDNATVCDIEQIRADIEAARYGLINDGLDVALRIIDKHIEGR